MNSLRNTLRTGGEDRSEVNRMNATEKQIRYIQLLASRLGRDVPTHQLFGKSKMQASLMIERLKRQVMRRKRQRREKRREQIRGEIQYAMRRLAPQKTKIRELKTRPDTRYTFTCPRCGSHNWTLLAITDAWEPSRIKVCAWCGNKSKDSVEWFSQLQKRHEQRLRNRS